MKDWERAQEILAKAVGGKVTPGSGNGRVKGDVVKDGVVFEVKQTCKTSMSIQRFWFNKLVREAKGREAVFVAFFELRGNAYIKENCNHSELCSWKSLTIHEDSLPEAIYSAPGVKWVLIPWTELKSL